MDFFASQERARRQTRWLLAMFALALVLVVAAIDAVALLGIEVLHFGRMPLADAGPLLVSTSLITLGLILSVTAIRVWKLRDGGAAVARMVGARRIERASTDLHERRLQNVVDEMAIAAGTPVPMLYVLDREAAINAFVAGYSPSQAAVFVTRGALGYLNRDELQAVIAHEFSHILNGDMRLNVRLLGWLAGILVLGSLGTRLVTFAFNRSDLMDFVQKRPSLFLVIGTALLGVIIAAIGYIGVFCGRLIKAGISREREFLADAAAVQFTRNPESLAMALHKIDLASARTRMSASYGEELSHMFFTNARPGSRSLMATHPPIAERIKRIHPTFVGPQRIFMPAATLADPPAAGKPEPIILADGRRIIPASDPVMPRYAKLDDLGLVIAAAPSAQRVVEAVGNPDHRHVDRAAALLASLPPVVLDVVRAPGGARATAFALVLDPRPEARERQNALLATMADTEVARRTLALEPSLRALDPRSRLPLLDMVVPELAALDPAQRQAFATTLDQLVRAGGRTTIPQLVVQIVVANGLRPRAERLSGVRFRKVADVAADAVVILSLLAHAGGPASAAQYAFAQGAARLGLASPPTMLDAAGLSVEGVLRALERLNALAPLEKPFVVRACADCVLADGNVHIREMEIMRALSAAIDCPLPPQVTEAAVAARTHAETAET